MDSVEATTLFFYATLGPSILLAPLWFLYGRRFLRGQEEDWEGGYDDSELVTHGLPGIVLFHIVLWWRENQYRKEHPLPEIGLGVWGIWALQFAVQVFYVTSNSNDSSKSWSVATRFLGMSLESSRRFGFGLMIDLWAIMIIVLWVSYWSWEVDANHGRRPPRSTLYWIQIKMTDSLPSAEFFAPMWFFLGHFALWGSGVALEDFLEAVLVVAPFQVWLNLSTNELLSPESAFTLMVYYGVLFVSQFVVPNGALQHYFRVPPAGIFVCTWICKILMAMSILLILALRYWQSSSDGDPTEGTTNTATPIPQPEAATTVVDTDTLREPLLSGTATTQALETDTLREPLLSDTATAGDPENPPLQQPQERSRTSAGTSA